MPDGTELRIVVVGGGPGGAPAGGGGFAPGSWAAGNGFVPHPADGTPPPPRGNGAFDPVVEAQRRIAAEKRQRQVEDAYRDQLGIPEGASYGTWRPGMAPPPVQGRAPALANGRPRADEQRGEAFTRAVGYAASAIGLFTQALSAATDYIHGEIAAKGQEIGGNDALGARITRRRNTASAIGTGVGIAGAAGAAGLFAAGSVGGPAGILLAAGAFGVGKLIETAINFAGRGDDEKRGALGWYGERLGNLGQFGGAIGSALATRQLDAQRRNLAEAAALGPEGARFIATQSKHEALSQELDFIKTLKDIPQQQLAIQLDNNKLLSQIRDESRNLTAIQREALKRFKEEASDALTKLLERQPELPADHKPAEYEALAGAIAGVLNQPVFRGQ